ncbi:MULTISPECIES: helix-turn-helix domain-containing protein [unclassified Streptosporangium]|uniref:helix-turn-helix domain-containing protein n=1 Tax=unclassified Streptosporangium TaxID=2632669 RepID=UPI002E2E7426|nr:MULTISPECIES: helix-turn-helix domain-containing protein [unclassified Streptosporangium]
MTRLYELPAGKRLDWREAVAQSVISIGGPGPGPGPEADDLWAEMSLVDLGITRLSRVRCTSFETRRAQHRIRQSGPGMYQLSLTLRARPGAQQQDHEADLGSAELLLYDTSRPFHAWTPVDGPGAPIPGGRSANLDDSLILQFPCEVLPVPRAEVERLLGVRLPAREGVGALLSGLLLQLVQQRDPFPPQEAVRISTVILDLLATLLTQDLDARAATSPNDPRGLMVMRVQAFIERNLGAANLSPSMIASAHHLSTRHLHRLFEEQDLSVGRWIRQRQLERCRRDLADPVLDTLPVRAVAARWGFGSESHFNRAFRAAYGIPPAAYRRSLRDSADTATAHWPVPLQRCVRVS